MPNPIMIQLTEPPNVRFLVLNKIFCPSSNSKLLCKKLYYYIYLA